MTSIRGGGTSTAPDNRAAPDDMDDMERRVYQGSGINAADSDEDGGDRTRFELDSDFSMEEEEGEGAEHHDHHHHQHDHHTSNNTAATQEESWAGLLTTHRRKNNTGGKGVLADYEEARKIQARRNETAVLQSREEAKRRAGGGRGDHLVTNSMSLSAAASKKKNLEHDKDEEQSSEDEDAFVQQWRAQRTAGVKALSGLPIFGKVLQVGKFEFVDEVDQSDPRTFVIVHLFEDYLQACRRMNEILTSLAGKYPHIKFLKLLATEADQTLSHTALPAFLVYKAGKLVGNASVNTVKKDFANEMFSEEDVEWFFVSKYGVPLPGVESSAAERKEAEKRADDGGGGGNNSEDAAVDSNGGWFSSLLGRVSLV